MLWQKSRGFRASCTVKVGVVLLEQSFQCFVCEGANSRIEIERCGGFRTIGGGRRIKGLTTRAFTALYTAVLKKLTVFETVKRLTVRSLAPCSSLTRSGLPAAKPSLLEHLASGRAQGGRKRKLIVRAFTARNCGCPASCKVGRGVE